MSSPATDQAAGHNEALNADLAALWDQRRQIESSAVLLSVHLLGLTVRRLAPQVTMVALDYSDQTPGELTTTHDYLCSDGTPLDDEALCDTLSDELWGYASNLDDDNAEVWGPFATRKPDGLHWLDVGAACAIDPPSRVSPVLTQVLEDAGYKVIDPGALAELRELDHAAYAELSALAEEAEEIGSYRRYDERHDHHAAETWERLRAITG